MEATIMEDIIMEDTIMVNTIMEVIIMVIIMDTIMVVVDSITDSTKVPATVEMVDVEAVDLMEAVDPMEEVVPMVEVVLMVEATLSQAIVGMGTVEVVGLMLEVDLIMEEVEPLMVGFLEVPLEA